MAPGPCNWPQATVSLRHEKRRAVRYGRHLRARGNSDRAPVTFAILTTEANDVMQPIHDRMPVILPLGHEKAWLPASPSGMTVFPPFPAELMTAYAVTPKMNRASFNDQEAILPLHNAIT
jgi:putative SOS response-associated peptidase YedK